VGRDVLSRIIYGTRTSLLVGIVSVGIAASVGMTLGLFAGYFEGTVYIVIMRLMDAMMSLPMILLALVIAALLGGGLKNVMIALGIGLVPGYARLMCAQTLSIKENEYVTAGRSFGASNLRIMFCHILPNSFPPLIVMMTMMLGLAILSEAGLSFLGIGIEPPGAAWGSMISDGYKYLLTNPILSFAPGIAIMLVVFAFNMVGDGLRDALDPRLRGTI
jgi:ABC-type dipeptide/oligopeptide/nickel transport system permease subunit